LPEDFVQVITKALQVDPADRYQTAGEMEAAILATQPSKPLVEHPLKTASWILAVLVVVLGGLSAFLLLSRPPQPLQARASFSRGTSALYSGGAVRLGDPISLTFHCPEAAYVYVLNEDDGGVKHILFPIVGGETRNPLLPGKVHRLPSEGLDWQVDSRGGEEWLCVLASREPIEELEWVLAGAQESEGSTAIGYLRIEGVAETSFLRSLAKIVPRKTTASAAPTQETSLRGLVEELMASDDLAPSGRKLWMKAIHLEGR
jgi:hypothetical protein